MDQDTLNTILKGTAYTGGGATAAFVANRLLGNKSAKSDVIAALIGAGLGGAATYLDTTNKDFSNTPITKAMESIKPSSKADVSNLTAPIIAPWQMLFGGPKYSSKERGKLKEKIYNLKGMLSKANPEQQKQINDLTSELVKDEARAERQIDAAFTTVGGVGGGIGGYFGTKGIGGLVNKSFNKKVDTAQKLVDTIFDGVKSDKTAQSIAAQLHAFNNAHPVTNDRWMIKLINKLPASRITTLLKHRFNNEALRTHAENTAKILEKLYSGTDTLAKATSIPTGKATNAFKDLVSFTKQNGFKHIGALKRFGVNKGILGAGTAAGVTLGALLLAMATNYKGSRNRYIDAQTIANK